MVEKPMLLYYKDNNYGKYAIRLKYLLNYLSASMNFCNSDWGRKILINCYKFIDSPSFRNELNNGFKKLYLTCDIETKDSHLYRDKKLVKLESKNNKEIIVLFNHRHNEYTGFSFFMKNMREFYKKYNLNVKIALTNVRKDLSSKFDIDEKHFYNKENLDYENYVKLLYDSDIIIGAHDGSNQWSMSFIDGLMSYNIPIYRANIFFDEILNNINKNGELTFTNDVGFQGALFKVCNNIEYYRKIAKNISDEILKTWTWDTKIHDFHRAFQTYSKQKLFNLSKERKAEIEKYLKDTNYIFWKSLKNSMNMGEQRPLNIYRKVIKRSLELNDKMDSGKSILMKKGADNIKIDRQKSLFTY